MLLTKKLLSFLYRKLDKDPRTFLALRLSFAGAMTWQVKDAVLTTSVSPADGPSLTVDLTQYTVAQLAEYLEAQPGYSIPYYDTSELGQLGARVLIDGFGDIALSNGDHLHGYTSVLWSWLEPIASELTAAANQIEQALAQMNTRTASDMWLDEIGAYYGVTREASETDGSYGPRIIAEVIRPRGNNVALESAIKDYTGQDVTVSDVVLYSATHPLFDGSINFDGVDTFNAVADPIYGLFDIELGYDLLSEYDITAFQNTVKAIIGRLRDAGTHLRALVLSGSNLTDAATPPADSSTAAVATALTDTAAAPSEDSAMTLGMVPILEAVAAPYGDGLELAVTAGYRFNGIRNFDGSFAFSSGVTTVETVGTPGDDAFSHVIYVDGSFVMDGSQTADGVA